MLRSDGQTALSFAYELDDAPDFENFYFITSDETFDLEKVMELAKQSSGGKGSGHRSFRPAGKSG
ncbi:hypothetical protein ACFL5V_13585 [Fibrobacterota bacterium]